MFLTFIPCSKRVYYLSQWFENYVYFSQLIWPPQECVNLEIEMCDLFSSSVLSDSYDSRDCSVTGFSVLSIAQSLLKLTPIELTMPSNQLILCHPLLLPSIFPNNRVFSKESVLHIKWPNYWNFSFSISPSNEYSGLISLTIDWFDLLTVQGTHKNLLQHHSFGTLLSLESNSHIHT